MLMDAGRGARKEASRLPEVKKCVCVILTVDEVVKERIFGNDWFIGLRAECRLIYIYNTLIY